jgi:hypothetical protein
MAGPATHHAAQVRLWEELGRGSRFVAVIEAADIGDKPVADC